MLKNLMPHAITVRPEMIANNLVPEPGGFRAANFPTQKGEK